MNSLAEIETAIDALPVDQKKELLLFLAARLRAHSDGLPTPRKFSQEQLNAWIAEDQAAMQCFRDDQAE
jgi:hypothetical protein